MHNTMKNINTSFHDIIGCVIYNKMYDIEQHDKTKSEVGKRGLLNKLSMIFLFERELNRHLKQNIHEATKIWERER